MYQPKTGQQIASDTAAPRSASDVATQSRKVWFYTVTLADGRALVKWWNRHTAAHWVRGIGVVFARYHLEPCERNPRYWQVVHTIDAAASDTAMPPK